MFRALISPACVTLAASVFFFVTAASGQQEPAAENSAAEKPAEPPADDWRDLFDGTTLDGWKTLDAFSFKHHGDVRVEEQQIVLDAGSPATGIAWSGEFPKCDYEVSLEAKRVEGRDFFCGLTFPVGDAPCTLIVGGWGGGIVGLSNVDDRPADENETSQYLEFEQDRWYRLRLRVTQERIRAWIDDERIVDLPVEGRKFSVWWEQEPAKPLGVATWYTKAALRNIRYRPASDDEETLFDGRSLAGWDVTPFGARGDVEVKEGTIVLGFGDGCTGITRQGDVPKTDYELSLEAMRVDGSDFFCGLTFPVGESPCSLIVGGWGGSVVGLSSIDGQDASANETTKYMSFKTGRWYRVRLRVASGRVSAWIDGEPIVDLDTKDRRISIRPEVERSKPLGIASWCTTAALRDIRLKQLKSERE